MRTAGPVRPSHPQTLMRSDPDRALRSDGSKLIKHHINRIGLVGGCPNSLHSLSYLSSSRHCSSSCSSGAPAAGRPHAAGSCCTGPGRTAPGAAAVGASCAGELGATGLQPRAARCSTGAGPAACAGGRGVGTASCRVRCARAGRRLVRLAGRRLVGPRQPAAFACAERAPRARAPPAAAAWVPASPAGRAPVMAC